MATEGNDQKNRAETKSNNNSKGFNKFILNDIYPEVNNLLQPNLLSIDEIKSNCLVVIDTNVLLVPYKTSANSLENIGAVYSALKMDRRLYIPAQVVREFTKNRGYKLVEVRKGLLDYKSKKQTYNLAEYPLLKSFKEFNEVKDLENQINNLLKEYAKKVNAMVEQIGNFTWNDPVSKLYGSLLNDCIYEIDLERELLENELQRRNLHNIPPGYKDKAKEDEGVGDLIIWKTILSIGEHKKNNLLFVTNEEKHDWWYRDGDVPVYPRYELIDEYRRSSEGKTFCMMSFSSFLALFGAREEVVNEVKQREGESTKASTYYENPGQLFIPIEWVVNRINPPYGTTLESLGLDIHGDLSIGSKVIHRTTGKVGTLIGLGSGLGSGVLVVQIDDGPLIAAFPKMFMKHGFNIK